MRNYLLNLICIMLFIIVFSFGCQQEPVADTIEPQTTVEAVQEPEEKRPVADIDVIAEVEDIAEATTEAPQVPVEDSNESAVVTVNGTVITKKQLQEAVNPILEYRDSINQKTTPSLRERYESQILDSLITELLVEEQFKANNISVTGEDVNNFIVDMITSSNPNMTLEELKSQMKEKGADFDQWKTVLQKRLEMEKLLEIKYAGQTDIPDEEAKKFYDENQRFFDKPERVRASHILIQPDTSDPNKIEQTKAAAKERAQQVLLQIKNGADFAELAKNYSDCPSASRGGDLGFKPRNGWLPAFSNVAFSLKIDEISDVVESPAGFHIIKATGHEDATVISFEQAKISIVNMLKSRKEQTLIPQLLEKLREDAEIIYPPGSTLRAYQPSKSTIREAPVNLLKRPANVTTQQPNSENQ